MSLEPSQSEPVQPDLEAPLDLEGQLDQYADLAVRIGANLQPGQRLLVRAPVETAPFVRRVVEKAYRAGSPLVDVMWSDEGVERARLRFAPDGSLDEVATWRVEAVMTAVERGDAHLYVLASDPHAYAGLDTERVAVNRRARQRAHRPYAERSMRNEVVWTLVAAPTQAWARAVFPDDLPEVAFERLWRAILAAARADRPGALERWRRNIAQLEHRSRHLTERRYRALHFRAPGTDLRVGLPDGHVWDGGGSFTPAGQGFLANLPTEEVFTAPHRERVDGTVRSSKPLSYGGELIEDFALTFEGGRVVAAEARLGHAMLRSILDTDEGARRLGEVALVPESSPIARSGLLFLENLFDENAASHLALGRAYPVSLAGGAELPPEELEAAGLNDSLLHVDFMIGSAGMDVDGVLPDGAAEPLMRDGEWVFPLEGGA